MKNKPSKFERLIQETIEEYGKDILEKAQEIKSWGIPALDKVLGGLPAHIVELYGVEGGGKSTLCLHAIAEAQKRGKRGVYIDCENGFGETYAKSIGVDIEKLLVIKESLMETVLKLASRFLSTPETGIVVIDSLPAMTPQAVYDDVIEKEDFNKNHVAIRARLLSDVLTALVGRCYKNKNSLIIVNQLREKVGVVFGNPETTPGGRALKHFVLQRIEVRPTEKIKKNNQVIGRKVLIRAVKNKITSPEVACELDLIYGQGFSKGEDK